MNLRDMEVFRAVMLTGTVKGASELLHVSQPAASKLLAQAERRSRLRLFERVKGRLVATPEAHLLYAEVEAVWRVLEKAQSVSRELAVPAGGSLRIIASARFCTWLVPAAATDLFKAFPAVRLHVDMVMPHLLNDALAAGAADLGIAMLPVDHPNLTHVRQFSCSLVCIVPAGHPLARRKTISAADLRGERLIAISQAPPFGQLLEAVYGDILRDVPVDIEVSSGPAACWFVQAGAGVAVLDATTVAGTPFAGLTAVPFTPSPRVNASIVRNIYRPLSGVAQAFCDAFTRRWRDEVLTGEVQPV